MADDDLDLGEEKKSSKKLFIIGGVLTLLIVVAATLYFTGYFDKEESETEVAADSEKSEKSEEDDSDSSDSESDKVVAYYNTEPPLIVNFKDGDVKLLQVSVAVMANSEESVAALKLHNPVIRNNMLMLLSGQNLVDLQTKEGKQALQTAALEEIKKIMEKRAGIKDIEQVFFTEFVMQ